MRLIEEGLEYFIIQSSRNLIAPHQSMDDTKDSITSHLNPLGLGTIQDHLASRFSSMILNSGDNVPYQNSIYTSMQ